MDVERDRAAVESPWWRWTGGLRAYLVGVRPSLRLGELEDNGDALREAGWLPDLDDPLTAAWAGALFDEWVATTPREVVRAWMGEDSDGGGHDQGR